jgi:hypothetical protein
MDKEEALSQAADVAMNAFYIVGQCYISEEDGGIADMVEEKLNFRAKIAMPMMCQVHESVGTARLLEGLETLGDPDFLAAAINPICGAGEWFSQDAADQAAAETSLMFILKTYEAFPDVEKMSLHDHMDAAWEISKSHLRSEANFRVKEESAPKMP